MGTTTVPWPELSSCPVFYAASEASPCGRLPENTILPGMTCTLENSSACLDWTAGTRMLKDTAVGTCETRQHQLLCNPIARLFPPEFQNV